MAVRNKRNTLYTATGFSALPKNAELHDKIFVGQTHSLSKWLEILGEPKYTGWREEYIVGLIQDKYSLELTKA